MQTTFNVQFLIRRQKTNSCHANIYCRITVAGQRSEFSLQRSCDESRWNSRTSRVDGKTEEVKSLNNYLDQTQARLFTIHQGFMIAGTSFTAHQIRNAFLGVKSQNYCWSVFIGLQMNFIANPIMTNLVKKYS